MPAPDIAIRELHPDFPAYIGKVALDIDAHSVPLLSGVKFAVAVGFPDRSKTQNPVPSGYQLIMPCVHVVADNISTSGFSFTLYSDKLEHVPSPRDFSGMSGGPIFWSDGDRYGLLGIMYASSQLEKSELPPNSIYIRGILADRETIEKWVSHVPRLHKASDEWS